MPIGEICIRDVVIAQRDVTVKDAAHLMRRHHVGNLVVAEEGTNGNRVPVGIVTDRDIVVSVIATGLDPGVYTLGDLVSRELVTAQEDEGIFECIQRMRVHGIRRMPVVDRSGGLIGIITVDDLIGLLSEEMSELTKVISREQLQEVQIKQ
jgi:CBS domain-containing protein